MKYTGRLLAVLYEEAAILPDDPTKHYGVRASSTGLATIHGRLVPIGTDYSVPLRLLTSKNFMCSMDVDDMIEGQQRWQIGVSYGYKISDGVNGVRLNFMSGPFTIHKQHAFEREDLLVSAYVECLGCGWKGTARRWPARRFMITDVSMRHRTCS